MRLAPALMVLAACGRINFDPRTSSDGSTGDDGPGATADAPGLGDGLVAYYEMEAPAQTLADSSPNHLDGSCVPASSCAITSMGVIGNAASFTGNGTYHVPDSPALHLAVFTAAAWVNKGQASTGFAKVQAAGMGGSFELALFDTDTWFCTDNDPGVNGEQCVVTGTALPIGLFVHIAMVFDGTQSHFYRDGVEVGAMAFAPPVYDASPLIIGGDRENGVDKGFFNGALDELRIYDRALTPDEVVMLRDLR